MSTKSSFDRSLISMSRNGGYTLVELLASMVVFSGLIVLLLSAVSAISSVYMRSDNRSKSAESGRAAIELMARELAPAIVDTRMQFVIMPVENLPAQDVVQGAKSAPVILWMAPLGPLGEMRCVGYYLKRDQENRLFQLKRIYIKPDNDSYFPRMANAEKALDTSLRTSPVNADWFIKNWDETAFDEEGEGEHIATTMENGIVALVVSAIDSMGNPIPHASRSKNHPQSNLWFNSAGYFHMAQGQRFDDDSSFVYLGAGDYVMKANRLPAAIDIALVMLGRDELSRLKSVPEMELQFAGEGAVDIEETLKVYLSALSDTGASQSVVVKTRVNLTNGG
ncbi:MAG: hypothetical protein AAF226_06925 [Verrucomicrobiota bacterium]